MQNEVATKPQATQDEVAKPQAKAKQNEVAKRQTLQNEEKKPQAKHKEVKNPEAKQVEVLPKLNGRYIMNAIRRIEGTCGCTVVQIKKYLQNEKKLECDAGSIKLYLKNAVDGGKLSLLEGKYKVNETARSSGGSPKRRRRRRSESRKKSPKPTASKKRKISGTKRRRRSAKAAE